MRRACLAVFVLSLAGVAAAQTPAERGQKIYAAEKCGVCHSIGGTGNKRGPLDGSGTKLTADLIRQWIVDAPAMSAKAKTTRKPPMKAYAHLAKEDVDALVAYLSTLKN